MITLKTLSQATALEVYEQGRNHLLSMKKRAINGSTLECQYRGDNGSKCVGGCFIADDEYSNDFENKGWKQLVDAALVPSEHANIIQEMQYIHDIASNWDETGLTEEAKNLLEKIRPV